MDQSSRGGCKASYDPSTWSPAKHDAEVQALILGLVLAEHPKQLTFPETVRILLDEDEQPAELDALARAVGELVSCGLLHRNGEHLIPSFAALRFDELPMP